MRYHVLAAGILCGVLPFVILPVFGSWAHAETPELMLTLARGEAYEEFGLDVADVGDVNGDGSPDLLVGAHRFFLDKFGRGYVYLGGAAFDTVPDLVFASEVYAEGYARAVAGAGDVNGDGFCDIIIGAERNGESASRAGKAYIYFGGTAMDSLPDVELHGVYEYGYFGCAVAGCGDVNVDGYDDVVIGAYWAGPQLDGEAYVYFGGSPMDTLVDLVLEGDPRDAFGMAVGGGLDVNGDSFADILVGDPPYSNGRAYVYFGGHSLDPVPDLVLQGEVPNSHFGFAMDMCDLNADGDADVIVGALKWRDPIGDEYGRAYIYRGGESIDPVPDLILTGRGTEPQEFGASMAASADLNLDGYRDLCVSAIFPDRIFIHAGERRMDRVEEVILFSPGVYGDYFGYELATFEDLTGDDLPDLVLGARGTDIGGAFSAGMVYVFTLVPGPVEIETFPHARQVSPGGELRYALGGTNTTQDVQVLQVWSEVLLPNGFLYEENPIWGPVQRMLAPGDTAVVQLTQPIPLGAELGQYSWTVRVGPVYPDSLWDTSSFEFEVVSRGW